MGRKQKPLSERKVPLSISIPFPIAMVMKENDFEPEEVLIRGIRDVQFKKENGEYVYERMAKAHLNINRLIKIILSFDKDFDYLKYIKDEERNEFKPEAERVLGEREALHPEGQQQDGSTAERVQQ